MRPWRRMIICKLSNNFCVYACLKWLHREGLVLLEKGSEMEVKKKKEEKIKNSDADGSVLNIGKSEKEETFSLCEYIFLSCGTLLLIFPHWDARRRHEPSGEEKHHDDDTENTSDVLFLRPLGTWRRKYAEHNSASKHCANDIFPFFLWCQKKTLSSIFGWAVDSSSPCEPFSFFVKTHSD